MEISDIKITKEYKQIIKALEKQSFLFVTGKAGTGKSTFINYLSHKVENLAIVAPTAIAALQIKGETIHSFFRFPPSHITPEEYQKNSIKLYPEKKKIIRKMEVLIIDEISMLLPNILDSINKVLQIIKKNNIPFGGSKVILVGDLLQLPPIVASKEEEIYFNHRYKNPYFFSADILKIFPLKIFYLSKVFRQKEKKLIAMLDRIRINKEHREDIRFLNRYCYLEKEEQKEAIYLVPTNQKAKQINKNKISNLKGKSFFYEAQIKGSVSKENWKIPASYNLELKEEARIIFLKNNKPFWVNGDLGKIAMLTEEKVFVKKDGDEEILEVQKDSWKKYRYTYSYLHRRIEKEELGVFNQFPLSLGWAITIHKSQGLTLEKITIDLDKGAFCTGQVYVALSRCRELENIYLKKPLAMRDVRADKTVLDFLSSLE